MVYIYTTIYTVGVSRNVGSLISSILGESMYQGKHMIPRNGWAFIQCVFTIFRTLGYDTK